MSNIYENILWDIAEEIDKEKEENKNGCDVKNTTADRAEKSAWTQFETAVDHFEEIMTGHKGVHTEAIAKAVLDEVGAHVAREGGEEKNYVFESLTYGRKEDGRRAAVTLKSTDGTPTSFSYLIDETIENEEGYVFAAYKAVDKIIGQEYDLRSYLARGITLGEDACSEVFVTIQEAAAEGEVNNNPIQIGQGVALDVIEASVRAYVAAINFNPSFPPHGSPIPFTLEVDNSGGEVKATIGLDGTPFYGKGEGPIAACFKAVSNAKGKVQLVSYKVHGLSPGQGGVGYVVVIVRNQMSKKLGIGRALGKDIIRASVAAYIQAIDDSCSEGTAQVKSERD